MRNRSVTGVLAALLVFAACTPEVMTPAPQKTDPKTEPAGEVTVSYPEEPVSLNPYASEGDTNATRDVLRAVLPTLLTIDPQLRYRPGLAVRVPRGPDIAKDRRSIVYHLDKKAKWSDGHPITADDIRFTWEAIRDARLPVQRASYRLLKDVEVIDPTKVRLALESPFSGWRDLFSAGDFILPKHSLEGKDLSTELNGGPPLSGGPYSIESWTKGLEITMIANPRWWGKGPALQRVKVQFVPDTEIALGLIEAGRTDVLISTSQRGLHSRAERINGVKASARFGSAWWELTFNCSKPPMNDVRFRQAVAAGIDRQGIVEALVRDGGRPLDHVVPARKDTPAFSRYVRDPASMREKLGSAGFRKGDTGLYSKGGAPIGASTSSTHALAEFVLLAIRQNVRDAGLNLELRSPVPEVLYGRWQASGEFDIALLERRGSPSMSVSQAFRSDKHPPAGRNYSRISAPELDPLLDAAETEPGSEAALMNQLAELVPVLPIFETKLLIAYREQILGTDPNATVEGPFWNIHLWSRSG